MARSTYRARAVNHLVKKAKICTLRQMRRSKTAMELKVKEMNGRYWFGTIKMIQNFNTMREGVNQLGNLNPGLEGYINTQKQYVWMGTAFNGLRIGSIGETL